MDTMRDPVDGGFASPVLDGQAVFRAVMEAMARPGTVRCFGPLAAPPAPLSPAAAAVVLTLCDPDTPVWLDPRLEASADAKAWLAFHVGAPLARVPAEAHFALVCDAANLMALENFAQGSQDYPDRSTTLVLQVDTLSRGRTLLLEGPGIERAAMLAAHPLPRHVVEQWRQNNARFPRGVDVILAAPEGVACLSRTTRIRSAET